MREKLCSLNSFYCEAVHTYYIRAALTNVIDMDNVYSSVCMYIWVYEEIAVISKMGFVSSIYLICVLISALRILL